MPIRKFINRLFSSQQSTHPAIIANNMISVASDKELPVRDCEFVVFDTELTGLNPRKDEIIAIGAVRIKNMRICFEDTFYALIKPRGKLHTPSTLIHRITPGELLGAEPIVDVLPRFIDFCGGAFLVGTSCLPGPGLPQSCLPELPGRRHWQCKPGYHAAGHGLQSFSKRPPISIITKGGVPIGFHL